MLNQFRHLYPQGSLTSELVNIDRGLYIVKVSVQDREIILGTGLAAAETIEKAEDRARERALMTVNLEQSVVTSPPQPSQPQKTQTSVTELPHNNHQHTPATAKIIEHPVITPEPVNQPPAQEFAPPSMAEEIKPEPTPVVEPQTNIFDQPLTPPPEETANPIELDFNEIRHKIDLEMKRLSWTKEQGREYLLSTYGKRSRLHLTDEELLEFQHYLENLPN